MKIEVFKSENEYITRDYDLTNCSVEELAKSLLAHCEKVTVNPLNAAVTLPAGEYKENQYIVKGTATPMSLLEVATEILYLYGRK